MTGAARMVAWAYEASGFFGRGDSGRHRPAGEIEWGFLACAGVAQLVEQLIRNQQVLGSSPSAGSNKINDLRAFAIPGQLSSYHIATSR